MSTATRTAACVASTALIIQLSGGVAQIADRDGSISAHSGQDANKSRKRIEPKDKGHCIADGGASHMVSEKRLLSSIHGNGAEQYCHYCYKVQHIMLDHDAAHLYQRALIRTGMPNLACRLR